MGTEARAATQSEDQGREPDRERPGRQRDGHHGAWAGRGSRRRHSQRRSGAPRVSVDVAHAAAGVGCLALHRARQRGGSDAWARTVDEAAGDRAGEGGRARPRERCHERSRRRRWKTGTADAAPTAPPAASPFTGWRGKRARAGIRGTPTKHRCQCPGVRWTRRRRAPRRGDPRSPRVRPADRRYQQREQQRRTFRTRGARRRRRSRKRRRRTRCDCGRRQRGRRWRLPTTPARISPRGHRARHWWTPWRRRLCGRDREPGGGERARGRSGSGRGARRRDSIRWDEG